jgi:hypothetical protein
MRYHDVVIPLGCAWSSLRPRGGGIGLFTGCAAGDTGAGAVIEVTDR